MSASVPSLPRTLSTTASSHDFHVRCRRHDPVFYISVPIFSMPTFPIRLRPCSAFNWGGLRFDWCLSTATALLGGLGSCSPRRCKWPL